MTTKELLVIALVLCPCVPLGLLVGAGLGKLVDWLKEVLRRCG